MALDRPNITSRIQALKSRALAALSEHRPEIAVPLLKQALELHQVLKSRVESSAPSIATVPSGFDHLESADLEDLDDDADRTALDLDEFDPMADPPRSANADKRHADHTPHELSSESAKQKAINPPHSSESHETETTASGDASGRRHVFDSEDTTGDELLDRDLPEESDALVDDFDGDFDAWQEDEDPSVLSAEISDPFLDPADEIEAGLPEPEEFDEAPSWDEISAVRTESTLTRKERALQEAILVGLAHGWDYDGIHLLAEVFRLHWWSSAKSAMARELDAGMTPQDLRLALVARQVWREHSEFHENLGHGQFSYPHRNLPWPTALAIARAYDFVPDPDELSVTLAELYDQWRWSSTLIERFKSFYEFVRLQFGHQPQMLYDVSGWSFVPDLDRRSLEDDPETQPPADLAFNSGCYRTPTNLYNE